jgi:phage terminase small subunit
MGTLRAPAGLGVVGKSLFKRIAADVNVGWELDQRDLTNLEGACRAAERAAELDMLVKAEGMTVVGSKGQTALHPGISEARMQRQLAASLLSKVEMSPPAATTGHLSGRQRANLRRAGA